MISKKYSKPVFTLSLDLELAWGTGKKRIAAKRSQFEKTRGVIDSLLTLFGKYEVSATWAVVGSMFLKGGREENSIRNGRDIVEKIRDFKIKQEVASHTFSHHDFRYLEREEAEADLDNCLRAAEELGVKLSSLVFPHNKPGHLDVLREKGFSCYRVYPNQWYRGENSLPLFVRAGALALETLLEVPPPGIRPETEQGLTCYPFSMSYLPMDNLMGLIPVSSRVKRAKKGIKKAVQEKGFFHLCFHPFNIASAPHKLLKGLEQILFFVKEQREKAELEVLTMKEVAGIYE